MTKIVGILNVTPDSFSDGGVYLAANDAIGRFHELLNEGASFVDIGAESTRPGAEKISPSNEWNRLEPILVKLSPEYGQYISIDTYHVETAEAALKMGAVTINDVNGLKNDKMIGVIKKYKANYIICHLAANDIQAAHSGDLISDMRVIVNDLLDRYQYLVRQGIEPDRIILDPGIGFGKTPQLNRELLHFPTLVPRHKVMIGYSRKRFLGERRMEIEPNLRAGKIADISGAAYLRVHDVKAHVKMLSRIY